jgi:potassium voltage-gated channel Eag-related subfamily H protein 8
MMMIPNNMLDQIRTNSNLDLTQLLNDLEVDDNHSDSNDLIDNCMYHTPDSIKHLQILKDTDYQHNVNNLALLTLNCQSLKAHWEAFTYLIHQIEMSGLRPDIIGITEVFKTPPNLNLDMNGYQPLITKTRPNENDNRGGVGMFIKEGITSIPRPDLSVFIPHVIETLFVEITCPLTNKPIIVGSIYRPNSPPLANLNVFLENLYKINEQIGIEKKQCYLMGDFNIDLLKINSHNPTKEFLDNMTTYGFVPLISKPTRITDHSATLIDNIISNSNIDVIESGILVTDVADHFGVFHIISKVNETKLSNTFKEVRSFTNDNISMFKRLLKCSDFSEVMLIENPEAAYESFLNRFQEAFNTAFPLKKIRISKKFVKNEPWMTNGILTSSIQKSKLLHKKLKYPSAEHIEKYKIYCKILNKIIRQAKRCYYIATLTENKNNIKQCWGILNSAINRNRRKTGLPDLLIVNNQKITDKQKIASEFNTYFSSIANQVCEKIPPSKSNYKDYLIGTHNKSFYMHPVIPEDIINISKQMKAKNSAGDDQLSTKLMKTTIEYTAEPLAHIFNLSFTVGTIPNKLKIAKIIPVHKKGPQNDFNNYRPISLLPAYSKLLEKIVCKQLTTFFTKENIPYQHQYGFRSKHATIHPITHLLHDISNADDLQEKHLQHSLI